MPVWKDDKIASDALSGKVSRTPGSKLSLLVGLAIVSLGLAGAALLLHKPTRTSPAAPASHQVPVPNEPTAHAERSESKQVAPLPLAKAADAPKSDVVVLPPVTLVRSSSVSASKLAKKMNLEYPKLLLPGEKAAYRTIKPSPFQPAYTALYASKPGDALEFMKTAAPESDAEKKEAQVLEGRALLALGKTNEARAKFEPLAFAASDTEVGCDALLGNFWAQAGTLTRCRDNELEMVRVGVESWGSAMASLEEARRIEQAAKGDLNELEKARALYQQALDSQRLEDKEDAECLSDLVALTNKLVLDPKAACSHPKAVFHKVEPGDSVEKIAKTYKVNQGQLKKLNRLNDKLTVRYGQMLKVLPGDVVYKVSRGRLTGTLYIDGVFIRRYPVGIGPGDATPVGTFSVERKVTNPDWYYDGKKIPYGDPGNILGTRWMGFSVNDDGQGGGLGVHGTSLPESVPGRESKGCVRMHNADVEELYDLMPQGGTVKITE